MSPATSRMRWTSSSTVMSAPSASTVPPASSMIVATSRTMCSRRAQITTWAPASAKPIGERPTETAAATGDQGSSTGEAPQTLTLIQRPPSS